MVIVVPFDGSVLSRTALRHAAQTSVLYEEVPLAVTVIPERNAAYAREKGWISGGEAFDTETIVARLREQVAAIAPDAEFEYVAVDKYAPSGTVSSRIRKVARNRDTSAIFIGSEHAGRGLIGLKSVGGRVAFEHAYDVAIIRNPLPEVEDAATTPNPDRPD